MRVWDIAATLMLIPVIISFTYVAYESKVASPIQTILGIIGVTTIILVAVWT